jgi:signal transduction histidine kinase
LEASIDRLRTFYTVLTKIHHLTVRTSEPQVLFDQACRVAVEDGGFQMAWVGRRNPTTGKVDVLAFSGVVEDYLDKIDIDLGDPGRSSGPTGTAVKTGIHSVCLDISQSPAMGPWKEDAALMGIRSSGAFPIRVTGEVWGALTLYSGQTGYFDDEVVRLVDEMALDLSFSLEVFERTRETQSLERQLYESRKLESLGALTAGIAHDFSNLLTIILGQVSVLETQSPAQGQLEKALQTIRGGATRGMALVRQMMALVRRTEPCREPVDLNQVAGEMVRFLGETLPRSVHRDFLPSPDPAWIWADPTQIQQLLLNLCLNARDAMPEGGTLSVATAVEAGEVVLTVADTGMGMDETTQERIFEPFFTTKEKGKGTGLGLVMVSGIVANHGGTLDLKSAPGRGSVFTCRFPADQRVQVAK